MLAYYLTTMTGICLAYAIAAISPNMEAANALLPTYVTTCMYFGGLFILFDNIPNGWRYVVVPVPVRRSRPTLACFVSF